jgi:hypothetical protein
MTSIKITKLLLMLFLGILLAASSAYPEPAITNWGYPNLVDQGAMYYHRNSDTWTRYPETAITDSGNPNLTGQDTMYDHRNSGTWTESALGAEGVSGAYFDVSVGVIINTDVNPYLLSHSDVISITAKHLETGFKFSLQPDICENYLGSGMQGWSLFLRPEDWMFEGYWEFTMRYKGIRGYVHKQKVLVAAGPKVFPMKPSHIQIVKSGNYIYVSWSAVGDPYPGTPNNPIDYRIQAYEDICPKIVFRGKWSGSDQNINVGTYDPSLKKVTFAIPLGWSGHRIRLENRIRVYTGGVYTGQGKAVEEFILP